MATKEDDEAITVPLSDIEICMDDVLGRGGYGMVYRGNMRHSGDIVAVKLLISNGTLPKRDIRELKKEARRLQQFTHHDNILNMHGVLMEPDHYGLVLEYMHFGSSMNFVKDFEVAMPLLLRITRQVIDAMGYLHSHDPAVLHLDMKADNILINNNLDAKICDFGLSEWKTVTCTVTQSMATGRRCTITHIAPEVLQNINAPSTKALDVYAFGITLWELYMGKNVYEGRTETLIRELVVDNQRPDLLAMPQRTIQIQRVISRCWQQDENARPSFAALKMEVEPIYKAYEKHLPAALKSVRQQICKQYAVNDQEYIDTEHLDDLEVNVTEETAPKEAIAIPALPASPMETDQPIIAQQEAPARPPPLPIREPAEGHKTSDPMVLNFDLKALRFYEKSIRKMGTDTMKLDLYRLKKEHLHHTSEDTHAAFNNPRKLQEIVNKDTLMRFELMRSNSPFFSAMHGEKERHVNFQNRLSQKQQRESDSQKFYSYQRQQRPEEMDADEKRRYDRMMDLRVCSYGRKLANGDIGEKLIKALKEPYYLKQALAAPDPKPGEPTKFQLIDPKVKELAKDPMILQIVLSQEPEILDSLMRQYPNLVMKMLAEGKTQYRSPDERRHWHRSDREMAYMLDMMRHRDDERMHRDPMGRMGAMGMMGGSRERRRQEEMMNQITEDRQRKEKEDRERQKQAEQARKDREKQQKKEQQRRDKDKKKEKQKGPVTEKMEIEQLKQNSAKEVKQRELQRLKEIEKRRRDEQAKWDKDNSNKGEKDKKDKKEEKGAIISLFDKFRHSQRELKRENSDSSQEKRDPQRDLKRENSDNSQDSNSLSIDQLSMNDAAAGPVPSPPKQTREEGKDPPVVKAEIQQAHAIPPRPEPGVKQEPARPEPRVAPPAPQAARGDHSPKLEPMDVDANLATGVHGKGATGGAPAPMEISHKHAGGGQTHIILHSTMEKPPNLQIGSKNTMLVMGDGAQGGNDEPDSKKKPSKAKKIDLSKFKEELLSMDHIDKVAMEIGKDWKRLCRELDLTEAEIEQLQHDYQINGLYEIMYQGIQKWTQKKGREATVRLMAKNLWTIGRDDIAKLLK